MTIAQFALDFSAPAERPSPPPTAPTAAAYPVAVVGTRALDTIRSLSGPHGVRHRAELIRLYRAGQWAQCTCLCLTWGVEPGAAFESLAEAYPQARPALEPYWALRGAGWVVSRPGARWAEPGVWLDAPRDVWRMPDGAELCLLDERAVAQAVVDAAGVGYALQTRALPRRPPQWREVKEDADAAVS